MELRNLPTAEIHKPGIGVEFVDAGAGVAGVAMDVIEDRIGTQRLLWTVLPKELRIGISSADLIEGMIRDMLDLRRKA